MVIRHVTNGNENEKDMVIRMGGNVIVTKADIAYNAGKKEGREEGRQENAKIIAEKDEAIALLTRKVEELTRQLEECK
ncbi:MAG: hypothetical protein IJ054_06275 [Lachnospiraceae bacterium]|nr:hypothetical protein [Lachnospiraceae bacterium]MBQ9233264.1 hypothetical protein [Lachnospiraceae bacterium]